MNLTEEKALEIGKKAMSDINFEYDLKDEIKIVFNEGKMYENINIWLINFPYGEEDYGRNVTAVLGINDDDKTAKELLFRNGAIDLGYDKENDKYFIKEKRP
jgi:hypothetical protein